MSQKANRSALLGRKLGMKKGLYFMNMLGETAAEVGKAKANENLKAEAEIVEKALNACAGTAMQFSQLIQTNPFIPLVAATDYLGPIGVRSWRGVSR